MQLRVINTGNFKLDGGAMFGVVPQSIWKKLNPPDSNNMCSWAMRCLLVEDGNRLILIDNGIGSKQSEKFFSFYYLHGEDSLEKSLYQAGLHYNDITDNFLTHLHFDHCGGGISNVGEKLTTTFPQATYWTDQQHWQWATNPNPREKASFLKENMLPMQQSGQLAWAEQPLTPNFDFIKVNGHTENMMLPLISYKSRKILFCADLFPSAAHIPLPYVMAYDVRPLLTMQEKTELLHRAATENWVLFFEHDPHIECATVQLTDQGVKLHETFPLSAI